MDAKNNNFPLYAEYADRGGGAAEVVAGTRCVILPRVKPTWEGGAFFGPATESSLMEEFVVDAPFSRFAETFRELKALI
jgi:hypothetical protein